MYHVLLAPAGRSARAFALAGFTAVLLAGCSSDVTRFADPLSNPFESTSRIDNAGQTAMANAAPVGRVMSQPLPAPIQTGRVLPTRGAGLAVPAHVSPTTAARTWQPSVPQMPDPSVTGTIAQNGSWTATGGTPIVMAQGESLSMLSTRYNVPADVLMRVNGFSSPAQIQPGARLVIPVRSGGAARVAQNAPSSGLVPTPMIPTHVAVPTPAPVVAETPRVVAPAVVAPVRQAVAAVPHPVPQAPVMKKTVAQATRAPVVAAAPVRAAKEPARIAAAPAPKVVAKAEPAKPVKAAAAPVAKKDAPKGVAGKAVKAEPAKVARAEPPKPAKVEPPKVATKVEPAKPVKPVQQAIAKTPVVEPRRPAAQTKTDPVTTGNVPPAEAPATQTAENGAPEFRWPARGRIIQGFKNGGNDGINIAVPEGTSVKAAEAGVVAYAGSELKGYGNLVLIRHPNGYVTAYANNSEIEVKRGDTVKRGQSIAKSGQTGNVASPQLHFELRKGQTPVDPTQFLAGL